MIFAVENHPVIIERKWGKGTLVLSSDSYFISNEALQNERQTELLVWLIGSSREVIFDEAHFGIYENPGIASLIRKYRLHGLVLGVIVLAILFVWRRAVSFVPPFEEREETPTSVLCAKIPAGIT